MTQQEEFEYVSNLIENSGADPDSVMVFDGRTVGHTYATALIGVTSDDRAVYDYNKMIDYLEVEDEMTYEEAADWIAFNVLGALPANDTNYPIIMFPIENTVEVSAP